MTNDPLLIYKGSDGEATKRLYAALDACGPLGQLATALFRAQKCSERAKVYRGGGYRGKAYDRKSWSMGIVCALLTEHGEALGIKWGWKQDGRVVFGERPSWVLYVDTPEGQISFHSPNRGSGPEYAGEWDGRVGASVQRVIDLATAVLRGVESRQEVIS
jgi:hypothetical protein